MAGREGNPFDRGRLHRTPPTKTPGTLQDSEEAGEQPPERVDLVAEMRRMLEKRAKEKTGEVRKEDPVAGKDPSMPRGDGDG